jgi:hypothetical protein
MKHKYTLAKSVVLAAVIILLITASLNVSPVMAQSGGTTRAEALVLVNSASASYADFQHFVQPYLDHFGIPYTLLNIATTPVSTTIADYAVIIIGHRQLDIGLAYLTTSERNNIVTAVNAGTGLVNFDNDLSVGGSTARYSFITSIFGFSYVTPPTATDVTFTSVTHYITERHTAGDMLSTGTMTMAGITLPGTVTALATSGTQPFLAVTTCGTGRAVQWGTYNWMSHAVKGPMYGLDDLVWRSIVWAARKPFVLQGMPPLVTMRVDDVSGPLDWLHIANEVGFKPWAGLFLDDINQTEAADLATLVQAGSATVGIHAFSDYNSFYYNQYIGDYPDAVMAANYVTGTQWFVTHNITPSTYVVPHHYEVGTNAFAGLTNWGVQFIGTHQLPGQQEWAPEEAWLQEGPYRLYESGQSTSTTPVYYADYLLIPGHPEYNQKFFNCVTEVRDEQVYEWIPSNDVTTSVYHGTRQLQRGLDGMVVPTLFAHQYNMDGITNSNWRAIMQGIASNLESYQPQYVTLDYACKYARAMHTSSITTGVYNSAQHLITATFTGATEMSTQFYVFTDSTGEILYQLFNVPTFSGSAQVVVSDTADSIPPTVQTVTPASGATAVSVSANVTARFSEAISITTLTTSTFELRNASNVLVSASLTYSATSHTATLSPLSMLANSSRYTATIKGGSTGVKDLAGNALASNYSWSFTTAAPAAPLPSDGPGGPIMVIASTTNPFGRYYGEILRAEGLNAYTVTDISLVNAATLASEDVVILGEMTLTSAQVTTLTNWVNAGGNLIAMRPDKQLAGLLGLTDASGTLANAYLKVNPVQTPAAGIVTQTIQYHSSADRYTLNGAAAIATLYSNATTATAYPAVTLRSVGLNGGQAAAFAYDLARSVVYTRQGNPAWAGQNRDGDDLIRSDDLFYGNASGDPQSDWIDFNKVAIPQADEQQRLLVNLITQMNLDRKPLPHFWYFPHGKKAVVIMTGDDHATNYTPDRFDQYLADSPSGCSVADWECIRSTAYIYPNSGFTNTLAASYVAQGFEVALHPTTNCTDYTETSLDSYFTTQLATFTSTYPSVPTPTTSRTHCVAWSDWSSQATVELSHSIRLDTNYYTYPPTWINDRPGMFTGSGLIMRFANVTGSLIDVFQAPTQMTDESGQTYPDTVNALLDRAVGAEGYYGAFTANMHNDSDYSPGANAIIASAQALNVPVVSARQMLNWLDGRNASSFANLAWNTNVLSFAIITGSHTNGIQAMLPISSAVGALTGITRGGSPIAYTSQTIKGISYAFFDGSAGSYAATYGGLAAVTRTLNAGWNLLALPLQPATSLYASSLLNNLNAQSTTGNCTEVDQWGLTGWVGYLDGMGFGDFAITPGHGYFVACNTAFTWQWQGYPLQVSVPVTLAVGWNLMSVPYPTTYMAQSLLDAIAADGGSCSEVDRWGLSGWVGYLDGMGFGDFAIAPDQGYFVDCTTSSTFTP